MQAGTVCYNQIGNPDQQELSSRDSDIGISHSSYTESCPASTTVQSLLTSQRSNSSGQHQITLAEVSNSARPHGCLRILFQHVHGSQEK